MDWQLHITDEPVPGTSSRVVGGGRWEGREGGRVESGTGVAERSRGRGRVQGRGRGAALEIRTGNLSKSVLDPVNSITSFLSWRFMSTETTQAYQGQGEEWDWERGPRPTSLFTWLLSSVLQCCFTPTETVGFIKEWDRE